MTRKIIIPAAGGAVRYGGLPKELLPISEEDCSLTHAIKLAIRMGAEPVVISNSDKVKLHARALDRAGLRNVRLVVRENWQFKDLWGSIEYGLASTYGNEACAGGIILADTVAILSANNLPLPLLDFSSFLQFGVFETKEPERFSIILPDRIATKEPTPPGNKAWGMILWDAQVAEYMLSLEIEHYDRAFEAAMALFRWETFDLASYHDLGTFKAYKEFLQSREPHATLI